MATQHVFVSRPTLLTSSQDTFCDALAEIFRAAGVVPHTVGDTDFTSRNPTRKVLETIEKCDGACVLGLIQIRARQAVVKPGTPQRRDVGGIVLPTPWNHLEAGMALARDLPLLVLCEAGVSGGIFDEGVGDAFVHHLPARGREQWLTGSQFQQSMAEWLGLIRGRLPKGML